MFLSGYALQESGCEWDGTSISRRKNGPGAGKEKGSPTSTTAFLPWPAHPCPVEGTLWNTGHLERHSVGREGPFVLCQAVLSMGKL